MQIYIFPFCYMPFTCRKINNYIRIVISGSEFDSVDYFIYIILISLQFHKATWSEVIKKEQEHA